MWLRKPGTSLSTPSGSALSATALSLWRSVNALTIYKVSKYNSSLTAPKITNTVAIVLYIMAGKWLCELVDVLYHFNNSVSLNIHGNFIKLVTYLILGIPSTMKQIKKPPISVLKGKSRVCPERAKVANRISKMKQLVNVSGVISFTWRERKIRHLIDSWTSLCVLLRLLCVTVLIHAFSDHPTIVSGKFWTKCLQEFFCLVHILKCRWRLEQQPQTLGK